MQVEWAAHLTPADQLALEAMFSRVEKSLTDQYGPPVVLNGLKQSPYVLGIKQPPLTRTQYAVVELLLKAGDAGIKKDSLESNAGGARRTLKAIKALSLDWDSVLPSPGKGHRDGYRIIDPRKVS